MGSSTDPRRELRADCSRCTALCCVAPAFTASSDFAIDKPAGRPCPNLSSSFGCTIHSDLRGRGFPGCAVFDCFGAGQHIVQVIFGGGDRRADPAVTESMFAVLPIVRQLKELLWYLVEASTLLHEGPLREQCRQLEQATGALLLASADDLIRVDASAHRRAAGALLERVSSTVREGESGRRTDHRNADLVGAALRNADLSGVCLRGAYLLGADLRGADLRLADLLGTDLRGADIRGAQLEGGLFLTQPQVDAATGDASTTLPRFLTRPRHWPVSGPSPSRGDDVAAPEVRPR